jgi:hypothetical protein
MGLVMVGEQRREREPGSETAHAAVDEVCRRAVLHHATGYMTIRIDFNQGHPRAVRIGPGEEDFKLNH